MIPPIDPHTQAPSSPPAPTGTTSARDIPAEVAALQAAAQVWLTEEFPARPWQDLSLADQQDAMLTTFTPAEWLTDAGYLVGAVLRHDDRQWYHWKALAKERGVDPYGYEKGVDKLLADLAIPRGGTTLAPATPAPVPAVRISARELKAKVLPPLNFVVQDILPAGCTLLTGKSKDGKSLLAYNLAVAVASGEQALGTYPTMAGSVWYLALEDGERRAQTRLALQEDQMGPLSEAAQDRLKFTLWEAPRLGAGLEEEIRAWIETTPDARLVIIDILEKVRPPRKLGGSTYAEDYTATSSLTRLAEEHNVAILILHHSNKSNPADFRDSASGAMSLVGGADNFWSLSRSPLSEDATLKITGRDLPLEYDLAMEFKCGFWTALGETRLVSMSAERRAIIEALQDSPRPLTPTQLARTLGKNVNTLKILLRKMLDAAVLLQPTAGHYALSPTYLTLTEEEERKQRDGVNPVNPINPVNPVNPVNPGTQPLENTAVCADSEGGVLVDEPAASAETVYGEFTGVYGEFTGDAETQLFENTRLNGDTVYGFTGFTGEKKKREKGRPSAPATRPGGSPSYCPGCARDSTWILRDDVAVCYKCQTPKPPRDEEGIRV